MRTAIGVLAAITALWWLILLLFTFVAVGYMSHYLKPGEETHYVWYFVMPLLGILSAMGLIAWRRFAKDVRNVFVGTLAFVVVTLFATARWYALLLLGYGLTVIATG